MRNSGVTARVTGEGRGYYNSNLTALNGAALRQSGPSPLGMSLDGAGSEERGQLIGDAAPTREAAARIIPSRLHRAWSAGQALQACVGSLASGRFFVRASFSKAPWKLARSAVMFSKATPRPPRQQDAWIWQRPLTQPPALVRDALDGGYHRRMQRATW